MNTDVSAILGFDRGRGRALLAFYGLGTIVVALLNLDKLISPIPSFLSLLLLVGALVILTMPSVEPFDLRLTLGVVAIVEVITLLSAWNLLDPTNPGYAAWHQGAITFVLLVLTLRGRRALAWAAYAGFAVITILSSFTTGQDTVSAINDVARQAGTLLIGTLFSVILRRAARSIAAIDATRMTRVTRDAATATAIRERAVQNARLERDARPALARIVHEAPLSAQELRAIALLEESLRDGITAAGFSGSQLADEIRFARERGIRIVLVDDRGTELDTPGQERVEQALIAEIRLARFGTVTARLSPDDRPELATIIVDEGGSYRSIVVTRDSVDITRLS
jgi:hypothetical protein